MTSSEQWGLGAAGYALAAGRAPADAEERRPWARWPKGSAIALAAMAALGVFLASGSTTRPLDATIRMEQLASRLEHSQAIHPDTAHAVARLIAKPWYDCNQVACSAQLRIRNDMARARLEALLLESHAKVQTAGADRRLDAAP